MQASNRVIVVFHCNEKAGLKIDCEVEQKSRRILVLTKSVAYTTVGNIVTQHFFLASLSLGLSMSTTEMVTDQYRSIFTQYVV